MIETRRECARRELRPLTGRCTLRPQHFALQEYRDTIDETERRVERLTDQLRQLTPPPAAVIDAIRLLDRPSGSEGFGEILETDGSVIGKVNG